MTDVLTIIGAVGAAIVLIINALGTHWGRKEAQVAAADQNRKLDVIHDLTNSTMSTLKAALAAAEAALETAQTRNAMLEHLLMLRGAVVPPHGAEPVEKSSGS